MKSIDMRAITWRWAIFSNFTVSLWGQNLHTVKWSFSGYLHCLFYRISRPPRVHHEISRNWNKQLFGVYYLLWCHSIERIHTVDGRNPAGDVKLSVDNAINYLQYQLVGRISSINSIMWVSWSNITLFRNLVIFWNDTWGINHLLNIRFSFHYQSQKVTQDP